MLGRWVASEFGMQPARPLPCGGAWRGQRKVLGRRGTQFCGTCENLSVESVWGGSERPGLRKSGVSGGPRLSAVLSGDGRLLGP